ncbi:BRO1-domain-containing protein [Coemansia reversa NRRL 1564]|uniref:BRO domain-containing protein 1 n=1 Tax=Coemansia reversa (strain ATCC 12441 / NRRL 1564) TaxID=763665 RepID=A0A2G5BEA6_COERN|nr:BRO1-domain-containing protein [Coemansia reversa NRRL 1564]|eukprot:PIA17349.1 BRO1-domain-containing protein [Coemansia reversa NRRL 1564]
MSKPPCIAIPFKKTSEADWVRPLRQYIARTLQDDPEAYSTDCQILQRMRQDMRGAKADETGKDLIFRYYSHLEALERRFRVGELGVKTLFQWHMWDQPGLRTTAMSVRMPILHIILAKRGSRGGTRSDAFTGESTQQHALAFEKAGVIFNLAVAFAMQGATLLAGSTSEMELDKIHTASIYFQVAADRLHFISKSFLHAPSLDLQQETVNVLNSIMMAQAQECAYMRSRLEKKKDVTLSKLAQQAALMYSNIFDSLKAIVDSHSLPRGWLLLVETKLRYYQAMAQYYEARSDIGKHHYGVAIARYSLAEQHAREATKLVGQFAETFFSTTNLTEGLVPESVQGLQDLTTNLAATIAEELSRTNHDNDVIYNDAVPNTSTLPPLEAANVAAHFDINRFYASEERSNVIGAELFTRLLPMAVHEGSSIYSEEKAKLIRAEEDKVNLADGELQDALSYMKLPDSLRRFERRQPHSDVSTFSGIDMSASELAEPNGAVRDAVYEVQTAEQSRPLSEMRARVESQRSRASGTLSEAQRLLDDEQRASESALSDYASEPLFASYQPSSRAAAPYREQIADNQKKLEDAAGLDDSILGDYRTVVAPWLTALQNGAEGVVGVLLEHLRKINDDDVPVSNAPDTENLVDISQDQPAGMTGYVHSITETYEQLLELKKVRRTTLSELKASAQDDDISAELVKLSDAKSLQPLFDRELRKYDGHVQRLQAAAARQSVLIKRISEDLRRLLELPQARSINKKWDMAESKKTLIETQVLEAAQVYSQVCDGLDKANRFYSQLLESLELFHKQVKDFVASRASLREQLVRQVMQDSASRNQTMLQERLSQYSASSQQQQQQYQPQSMQPGYPTQQQHLYAQPPSARSNDPYDTDQLAGQAARMSLNSPSGEPATAPQMLQQHGLTLGEVHVPQYQSSAPPPQMNYQQPQLSPQQQYMTSPPQPMHSQDPQYSRHQQQLQTQMRMQAQLQTHHPYQQSPQQPQPQPAQPLQMQMQSTGHSYSPVNHPASHYGSGHVASADAHVDPYSGLMQKSAVPEHSNITGLVNSSYNPGYGGYPSAPVHSAPRPGSGLGVTSVGYVSGAAGLTASSPVYAGSSHSAQQQQPLYRGYESTQPNTAAPVGHPATTQSFLNGYAPNPYPSASQGHSTNYTNVIMGNAPQQPLPQQSSPYQHQSSIDQQIPPYSMTGQAPGIAGPMGYQQQPPPPPPQQQQQQPYRHPQQLQPPQPPQGYSHQYTAPQYAPMTAPYSNPGILSQAPVQPMSTQAAPSYGYGQPQQQQSGYPPPPPPPPDHYQQAAQQQQQQQQYQHGYGGNVGTLMD